MDQFIQAIAVSPPSGAPGYIGGGGAGNPEEFALALADAVIRGLHTGGNNRGIENSGWDWTAADGTRLRFGLSAKEETSEIKSGSLPGSFSGLGLEEELVAALRELFARALNAGSLDSSPSAIERNLNIEKINSFLGRLVSASSEAKPLLIPVETGLGKGLLSVSYLGTNDASEHTFSVSLETRAGSIGGKLTISILQAGSSLAIPAEILEAALDANTAANGTIQKQGATGFVNSDIQTRNAALNTAANLSVLKFVLPPPELVFPGDARNQLKHALPPNQTVNIEVGNPANASQSSMQPTSTQTQKSPMLQLMPGTINDEGAPIRDLPLTAENQSARPANSGSTSAFLASIGSESSKTNRPLATLTPQILAIDEPGDASSMQAADVRLAPTPNAKAASQLASVKLGDIPRIVMEQIVDMKAFGQTGRLVVMETDPPHLGPITSRIEIAGSSLSVTLIVANAISRDAIEHQLSALRAALESQGFGDAQLNVEIGTGGGEPREFAGYGNRNFKNSDEDIGSISTKPAFDANPFGGVRGAVYI